jgi:hypothetical protein
MSFRSFAIAASVAALCLAVSSVPVLAQENCGFAYQRVMQAYQEQSPYYTQMLSHYNEQCLSGSSFQPTWEGYSHYQYDQDRRGYDNDRRRWVW